MGFRVRAFLLCRSGHEVVGGHEVTTATACNLPSDAAGTISLPLYAFFIADPGTDGREHRVEITVMDETGAVLGKPLRGTLDPARPGQHAMEVLQPLPLELPAKVARYRVVLRIDGAIAGEAPLIVKTKVGSNVSHPIRWMN